MADILVPPWLAVARVASRYIDSTGVSVGEYTGARITGSKGGDRLAGSLEFTTQASGSASSAMARRAMIAFLSKLRGRQNRFYLTDPSRRLAGSFPTGEVLANNTFADGTTGWFADSNGFINSVHDRTYRATRDQTTVAVNLIRNASAVTGVQYAPYVQRVMVYPGRNPTSSLRLAMGSTTGGSDYGVTATGGTGYRTLAVVPFGTSIFVRVSEHNTSGVVAGDYYDIPWISLSRCMLADVGVNALLRSDEFDNAAWTKTRLQSVGANAAAAPDGTTTADSIIEDTTASNTHHVQQGVTVSSGTDDYCFAVALKAGARTWARLLLFEATGSNAVRASINLSTGALGIVDSTGANMANPRAYATPLGNGWHYVAVLGRKTNAATTITGRISLMTGESGDVYTGDGTSNILAWRGTLAASGVPVRLVATTSAATSGASPTGSAMHVKVGPASGSGQLLPGDMFEVITTRGSELKIVTSSLDTDAAGMGYLQFEPPLRGQVLADAPIIVHEPMGRFLFAGQFPEWLNEPGIITRASLEFEEAA